MSGLRQAYTDVTPWLSPPRRRSFKSELQKRGLQCLHLYFFSFSVGQSFIQWE